MLIEDAAGAPTAVDYPDTWVQGGHRLRLTYQFEPGSDADVTVPSPWPCSTRSTRTASTGRSQGCARSEVTELIRSCPRRSTQHPRPQLGRLGAGADRPGRRAAARRAGPRAGAGRSGRGPAPSTWPRCPALRMTFRVGTAGAAARPGGRRGQGPGRAQAAAGPADAAAIAAAAPGLERDRVDTWDLGTLPRVVEERRAGLAFKGFPALVDEGGGVAVRLLETEAEQAAAMWAGTRRLLLNVLPSPVKYVLGRQTNQAKLTLGRYRHGAPPACSPTALAAAADDLIAASGGGLGRGRVPPAARRGPGRARRRHPGRGQQGRAGPGRGRPGRGPPGRAGQPGVRPGHRRRPRPARRPRLPGWSTATGAASTPATGAAPAPRPSPATWPPTEHRRVTLQLADLDRPPTADLAADATAGRWRASTGRVTTSARAHRWSSCRLAVLEGDPRRRPRWTPA